MSINTKINQRLDELEKLLAIQGHLGEHKQEIDELIASITKFTSVLSQEQRDFINAVKFAVERQTPWR